MRTASELTPRARPVGEPALHVVRHAQPTPRQLRGPPMLTLELPPPHPVSRGRLVSGCVPCPGTWWSGVSAHCFPRV